MIYIDNIFAVIDPTTDKQYALQRAAKIARITGAKIRAYLCISTGLETHDQEALRQTERSRYELWLNNILVPIRAEGIEVITQLDWKSDWRSALGNAAYQAYSDLIVKPSRRRTAKERLMMTSSDSRLFETARCPVLLVTSEVINDPQKVLIAVDAKREDEQYQRQPPEFLQKKTSRVT